MKSQSPFRSNILSVETVHKQNLYFLNFLSIYRSNRRASLGSNLGISHGLHPAKSHRSRQEARKAKTNSFQGAG
jgi:hypothetical protein